MKDHVLPITFARCCRLLMPAVLLCAAPLYAELPGKLGELEKKLPQVKVEETVINVSPETRIYLPNGSMDLNLKQSFRNATVDFGSHYDFVDNSMGFTLDFLYDLKPLSPGVNLYDRANFNEVFSDKRHLQRAQAIAPYLEYHFSPTWSTKGAIRFENTYTDEVTTLLRIDQGRNNTAELSFNHDNIDDKKAFPTGGRENLIFIHSLDHMGSDFSYTQTELRLRRFLYFYDSQWLEYKLFAGYPNDAGTRPLTSVYTAGGYRMLRGYDFKEFRGNALIHHVITYNLPIRAFGEMDQKHISFSLVTWDIFMEAAKIGEREIYTTSGEVKASGGAGIGYKIMVFGQFPIQIELSAAKAFEPRETMYYLTLSTIYFTLRND